MMTVPTQPTDPLLVVVDAPPLTGIGVYADSLVRLMKPVLPQIRLVSLHPSSTGIALSHGIPGLRSTKDSLAIPWTKRQNRGALKRFLIRNKANLHLAGADYSLVESGTAVICTVHDFFFRVPSRDSAIVPRELATEALINFNFLKMTRQLRQAAGIVCPSHLVEQDLDRRVGLRSQVIHHWIDADRFHPRPTEESRRAVGVPTSGRFLLNVGGPGPNKNLKTLTRIAQSLPPGWKLIKVGHPIASGNSFNVGRVSPAIYPKFYNAADAYLHTSVAEGFGIPLIESMGSATPVILPRGSTGPELLGDAGIYIGDPEAVSDFVAAIVSLEDETVRSEAAARSLARSVEFAPEKARQAYQRFYENTLGLSPNVGEV